VFWWVELDLFSLECREVSGSEFWGEKGESKGERAIKPVITSLSGNGY